LENYVFDSWTKFGSSELRQVTELKLMVCLRL